MNFENITSSQSNCFRTVQSNPCAYNNNAETTTITIAHDSQLIHEQKCYKNRIEIRCVDEPIYVFSKRQLFCVHEHISLQHIQCECQKSPEKKRRRNKKRATKTWIKRQIDNSSEKHFMFILFMHLREIKTHNMYKCSTHALHSAQYIRKRLNICMHHEEVYTEKFHS